MTLSCFGNASIGELANARLLTLNNISGLTPFRGGTMIDGGPCVIPGFLPANLPNFILPPIPLFPGIPPFPFFCFIPPFPGIPALSLPAISISIPPIPFLPPIPLPIPGFSLPLLPSLPLFNLGSLNFICGLLNIELPVLDPFAFLRGAFGQLNALITSFNDFLKFCEENQEAIANTQVPPFNFPSIPEPALIVPNPNQLSIDQPLSSVADRLGGLNVNEPIETGDPFNTIAAPPSLSQTTPSLSAFNSAWNSITISDTDTAEQWAYYLASKGLIPPEPTVIGKLAGLLNPNLLATEITPEDLFSLIVENNIPSLEGFIGFTVLDLEDLLTRARNCRDLANLMVEACLILDDSTIKQMVCDALRGIDFNRTSALTIASILNAYGVPYGCIQGNSLSRIKPEDIARAFYVKSITLPFTPQKILRNLLSTGVVSNLGTNSAQALAQLTPLPEILTPKTLSDALLNILPGPGIDSLKAACIASIRGTSSPRAILEMDKARADALLQSVRRLSRTTLVETLINTTFEQFRRKVIDVGVPIVFPLSVFELIPILSVAFDEDDQVWQELLAPFDIPTLFYNFKELYNFINIISVISSSEREAQQAITTCSSIKENDFSFNRLTSSINSALNRFNIQLPSSLIINRNIANALQIELGYNTINTLNVLGSETMSTIEELGFYLLATGALSAGNNIIDIIEDRILRLDIQPGVSIKVNISSPTNVVSDISQDSLNIIINTKTFTSAGIIEKKHVVIENGSPTSGSTVLFQLNDITQTFEIGILRINGFIPGLEVITSIDVRAEFSTVVRSQLEQIPQYLINIKF